MKKLIFSTLFILISAFISAQKTDNQVSKLYKNYLEIKNALVSDDSEKTSKAANEFIKTASSVDYKVLSEGNINTLKKDASAISDTRNIATQRTFFANLSTNMLALAREFKTSDKSVFVQYCPMQDATWLSDKKNIENPYFGNEMLTCGSLKSEIK